MGYARKRASLKVFARSISGSNRRHGCVGMIEKDMDGAERMTEEENKLKPLSKRHQYVMDEYLVCWSKTVAYKKAYPSASHTSAKASAARLFADVNFSAHLQARLSEIHMSADEALALQTEIARVDLG